jgi:hypothetical protein
MNTPLSTIDRPSMLLAGSPVVVASGCVALFLIGVFAHTVPGVFLVAIPVEIIIVFVGAAILAWGLLRRPSRKASLIGLAFLSVTIIAQIYPWPSASISARAAYWIQFFHFKSQLDVLQNSQREAGTYDGVTFIEVEGWNALSSGFAVIDTNKSNAQALVASHRGIGGARNESISSNCDVEWYHLRKRYFHWNSACER